MSCFGGSGFQLSKRRSPCSNTLIRVCSALPDDDSETETETGSSIPESSSVSRSESFESDDTERTPSGTLSGSDQLDLASSNDSEDLKNFPPSPTDALSLDDSVPSTPEPLLAAGAALLVAAAT